MNLFEKVVITVIAISLYFLLLIVAIDRETQSNLTSYIPQKEQKVTDTVPPLTKDNVLREIAKHDIKEIMIVYKQALLETMHLQCSGCSLDYNNLFGIRHKKWITKDNPMGYKEEKNWVESIKSYKEHIQNRYKGGDYYLFLQEIGYATDPNYINKLKSIK